MQRRYSKKYRYYALILCLVLCLESSPLQVLAAGNVTDMQMDIDIGGSGDSSGERIEDTTGGTSDQADTDQNGSSDDSTGNIESDQDPSGSDDTVGSDTGNHDPENDDTDQEDPEGNNNSGNNDSGDPDSGMDDSDPDILPDVPNTPEETTDTESDSV